MRLNTKILDAKGEAVPYTLETTPYNPKRPADPVDVTIMADVGALGWMRYSVYTDDGFVQIRRMENTSSFRHVGTALFECAFRKSIEVGMGGRVQLDAIEVSPGAYFKMGFRKKTLAANFLHRSIQKYLSALTAKNKNNVLSDSFYPRLVAEAARNLSKPERDITFKEAIHHGCLQQDFEFKKILDSRKAFKELLNEYSSSLSSGLKDTIISHALYPKLISKAKDEKKEKEKLATLPEEISFDDAIRYGSDGIEKVSWSECYTCYMHGTMFLPDDIIAQKKIEFGIVAEEAKRRALTAAPSSSEKAPKGSSPPARDALFVFPVQKDLPPARLLTSEELAASEVAQHSSLT